MEQSCYKCGQMVEEGRVFCPHCSAPQIRVLVAEPAGAALSRTTEGTAGESALPASQTVPVLALPVQWSRALKPCGLAAVVATALMFLGLHPFVAMPCAGFLSVVFYRQGQPVFLIRLGTATRVGAFAGLLYSALIALLTALAALLPEAREKLHEQVLENVQKMAEAHADNPQLQELLRQLKTPDGFVVFLMVLGAVLFISSVVLGGAGGAVAGAIFGRRDQR